MLGNTASSDFPLASQIPSDSAGAVSVAGATSAADFPTTEGALDRTPNGGYDAFSATIAEEIAPDVDGDGYSPPADCDDTDAAIHPGAPEPCNGVDDDCDAGTGDGSGEAWYGAPCDGPDDDLCAEGSYLCTAGAQVCTDASGNNVEFCDGVDNNCNGEVDEQPDADGDGAPDCGDNCPALANPDQKDLDQDGVGGPCDNCPGHANPTQADANNDGLGDACTAFGMQISLVKRLEPVDGREKWRIEVSATNPAGIRLIEIWVNGEKTKSCRNASSCDTTAPATLGEPAVGVTAFNGDNRFFFEGAVPEGARRLDERMFDDDDGDGVGNLCDNCRTVSNDQRDTDKDCALLMVDPLFWDGSMWLRDPRCDDACDNCPDNSNEYQEDWDGDVEGDACDCGDNLMGPFETAADCGGICPESCDDKWTRLVPGLILPQEVPSLCLPILKSGDPREKIDIVFVPDEDNAGDLDAFRADVRFLIWSGYFGAEEFNANDCKFNLYYFPEAGDYQSVCQAWDIPWAYRRHSSFADFAAIIFHPLPGERACSSEVFSAPVGSARTVVHETGHKIFGMKDEYCCDGGYRQTRGHPNIFHSLENCQTLSENPAGCANFCPEEDCTWASNADCRNFATANGLDPDDCDGTCSPNWGTWRGVDDDGDGNADIRRLCVDGGDGWWKSDPNTCYMKSGTDVFEPDCHTRVTAKFDSLPECAGHAAADARSFAATTPDLAKVAILKYHIKQGAVELLSAEIAYNAAPNHFNEEGDFLVRGTSATGAVLMEIAIDDPREFSLDDQRDNEQGMMMGDDLDFVVILPLVDGLRTLRVIEGKTQSTMHVTDLAAVILDFCTSNSYDPLCASSDLDGDGYPIPTDCDDQDASAHPGAVEVCDGVDNDCDGHADENSGPEPFTFADQTGVAINTTVTSNAITVSGICLPVPISIAGGKYSVRNEPYTDVLGTRPTATW